MRVAIIVSIRSSGGRSWVNPTTRTSCVRFPESNIMGHYLREHLHAVGELPEKLRETMSCVGQIDERVQAVCALIDQDVGRVARIRRKWMNDNALALAVSADAAAAAAETEAEAEMDAGFGRKSKVRTSVYSDRTSVCISPGNAVGAY